MSSRQNTSMPRRKFVPPNVHHQFPVETRSGPIFHQNQRLTKSTIRRPFILHSSGVSDREFEAFSDTQFVHDTEHMDVDDDEEQWEKFRKWAAACVVAYATYAIFLISLIRGPNHKNDESIIERDYERQSLIRRLTNMNDEDCREQLRMRKGAFANLVNILRG